MACENELRHDDDVLRNQRDGRQKASPMTLYSMTIARAGRFRNGGYQTPTFRPTKSGCLPMLLSQPGNGLLGMDPASRKLGVLAMLLPIDRGCLQFPRSASNRF